MRVKPRHEYKHSMNYCDYIALKNRLKCILPRDKNSCENGYSIRSLYFDTPTDTALRDKIDGVNRRDKFRIRMYNNDTSFIRLERKSKINGLCYKEQCKITQEDAERIINNDILWIPQDGRELLIALYCKMQGDCLRPKKIVEYKREAFCFPAGNIRITFDSEIKAGGIELFNPEMPLIPVSDEIVLLEVKYDEFVPSFITNLLQINPRRSTAFSKYAVARQYE